MEILKFILIDDNDEFRKAFRKLLTSLYDAQILDEASNESEIDKITSWTKADIIFMDVMMPGKNGIQLTRELLWKYNKLNVVAVTMHFDKVYLTSLIGAGFKGCIFKDELVNQLSTAIKVISKDMLYFPENILLDFNKKIKK
ncbi:MAG: response regulator transcription factor [Bacteroidetes bacterium]|nr:response regulator transcription factor [Bacteroidota bacterium]